MDGEREAEREKQRAEKRGSEVQRQETVKRRGQREERQRDKREKRERKHFSLVWAGPSFTTFCFTEVNGYQLWTIKLLPQ